MAHLEENTVIAFVSDKLDAAARRQVEEHIDRCPDCRKLLAAMGADSSLLTPYAGTLETETNRLGAAEASGLAAGDVVANRYTIVKTLGRGGMGHVFLATDKELQIDVALKMLRPELTRNDEQVRHLRREILANRAISHPNACRVFDLGRDERFYFITMEYVAGVTLEERMRAGKLPTQQALDILETLLSVLAAAHKEGIVHRDLKPANLMLDKKDRIKVMDFGLARDLKGETSLVGAVGTPAYWAPEQARGEPAAPTADVFAVGVIAYLLLSGAMSTQAILRRLDRVPPAFRPWIQGCLAEDPAERFQDASAAAEVLAQVRAQKPVRWPRYALLAALVGALATGGVLIARSGSASDGSSGSATGGAAPAAAIDAALAIDAAASPVAIDAPPADAAPDAGVDAAPIDVPVDAAILRPRPDAGVRQPPPPRRDAGPTPDASLLYE